MVRIPASDDVVKARGKLIMESDFEPIPGSHDNEAREAAAAEYSAYQLGQINRNLKELIELLRSGAAKT